MASKNRDNGEAARIRERLARLAAERQALQTRLAELQTEALSEPNSDPHAGMVNGRSPAADKIGMLRSLCRRVVVVTQDPTSAKYWLTAHDGQARQSLLS